MTMKHYFIKLEKIKRSIIIYKCWRGNNRKDITEDIDWVNNWKQFFKAFTVGEFYIKPTWEEIDEAHKDMKMIEIDPGLHLEQENMKQLNFASIS